MPNTEDKVEIIPPASELCAGIHLEKPARKLLREEQNAVEFIRELSAAEHFPDAVRVLAHLLPKREAIWWACQCARQSPVPDAPPESGAALEAAEKWVTELTEEARRNAGALGQEAGYSTAAGCAAMAAFASSGSFAPPDAPPVPAAPHLSAQFVAASIMVSSLSPNPVEAPDKYRLFIDQGLELYRNLASGS